MDKLDQRYAPLTELLFQKATREKIPLNGTLELSPICNMNCKMCYIHKSVKEVKEHPRPMMRLNEWISLAEEMKRQGTLYLLLQEENLYCGRIFGHYMKNYIKWDFLSLLIQMVH